MPLIPATQISLQTPAVDGWTADASTWTYASASTFTVSGDQTTVLQKGTRLKFTQTTVKYGVVVAVSYSAPNTTVTIAVNTDYVLANAAITNTYYSYQASPSGYPTYFAWTPTWTGFSADPGTPVGKFLVVGNMCICSFQSSTGGTSNATSLTMTLPITPLLSLTYSGGQCANGGAAQATVPMCVIVAATQAATWYRDTSGNIWTNTGSKYVWFTGLSYWI